MLIGPGYDLKRGGGRRYVGFDPRREFAFHVLRRPKPIPEDAFGIVAPCVNIKDRHFEKVTRLAGLRHAAAELIASVEKDRRALGWRGCFKPGDQAVPAEGLGGKRSHVRFLVMAAHGGGLRGKQAPPVASIIRTNGKTSTGLDDWP